MAFTPSIVVRGGSSFSTLASTRVTAITISIVNRLSRMDGWRLTWGLGHHHHSWGCKWCLWWKISDRRKCQFLWEFVCVHRTGTDMARRAGACTKSKSWVIIVSLCNQRQRSVFRLWMLELTARQHQMS